jgi:hypothetical protein
MPEAARIYVCAERLLKVKIQITPLYVTKVWVLVLLQTCRHLADETAALFYTKDTFNCELKMVPAQKAATESPYTRASGRPWPLKGFGIS